MGKRYELAWHFIWRGPDGAYMIAHEDIPLEVKKWYKREGMIEVCQNGYHASTLIQDAFAHHNGPGVCLVQVDGEIDRHTDKLAARKRRALFVKNVREVFESLYDHGVWSSGDLDHEEWAVVESILCDGENIP